jgi:site-specific DNA-cytosine methylase
MKQTISNMKDINVISLFDGMSCGQIALNELGFKINNYFAAEIEPKAIEVTNDNYSNTIQLGDVTKVKIQSNGIVSSEKGVVGCVRHSGIDLLIGGSPCQGFSTAGLQLNFDDSRSKLFFEFVRILKETKPKYFLLENVWMKKEWQDVITSYLGVEPIEIDSNLITGANRRRLYWTNIPNVTVPQANNSKLFAVLESGNVDREKAFCIDANYGKGSNLRTYFEKSRRQIVFEGEGKHEVKDGMNYYYRLLSPIECERLHGVPDNYTKAVAKTNRYHMLGNGWSVQVIKHIFKNLKF